MDKLFIKVIKENIGADIYFVVRSEPTLNDIIMEDAQMVGIDEVAYLVENGIKGPLPGTVLSRCSEELKDLASESDLIISKGGGNFETVSESKELRNTVSYLLSSKCEVYSKFFGIPLERPILSISEKRDT